MAAELEDKVVSVDFVWSPAGDSDPVIVTAAVYWGLSSMLRLL